MRWRCVCGNGKQTLVGPAPTSPGAGRDEGAGGGNGGVSGGVPVNRKQLITGKIPTTGLSLPIREEDEEHRRGSVYPPRTAGDTPHLLGGGGVHAKFGVNCQKRQIAQTKTSRRDKKPPFKSQTSSLKTRSAKRPRSNCRGRRRAKSVLMMLPREEIECRFFFLNLFQLN